jgi:protein phosphatase
MGGHKAGDRASQLAVDSLVTYVLNTLPWCFRLDQTGNDNFDTDLKAALCHCQDMLQRDAEVAPQRRGMGTTLTMSYIIWPRMYIVHVGDSRCYLLRKGVLTQITRDHTMEQLVQETSGAMEGNEVGNQDHSNLSNVLWNVISADDEDLQPEVYQLNLEMSDGVMLCTDGLTKHVDHSRLVELLIAEDSSEAICRRLIGAANDAGGTDNITVVVGRFCDREDLAESNALEKEREVESQEPSVAETAEWKKPIAPGSGPLQTG